MQMIENWNLSVEECFLAFFALSFALLFLIGLAALPGVVKATWRELRLLGVRSRRGARMLADKKELLALSRRLEGVYYFDEPTVVGFDVAEAPASASPECVPTAESAPEQGKSRSDADRERRRISYREDAGARRRAPDAA